MKLLSFNVNGLRAAIRKDLWSSLKKINPDIFCLQETKAKAEQVPPDLNSPTDYHSYFHSALRPGYSGTATYSRPKPQEIINGLKIKRFDQEGRVLITKYPQFTLINTYFPHTGRALERLDYKLDFCRTFYHFLKRSLAQKEKIICCGDLNIAHHEIDLARPHDNLKNAGFLPQERAWMDRFLALGLIDSFRHFYPQKPDQYTWWSQRTNARPRNIGWRIDYFLLSANLLPHLKKAFILPQVLGSDHCPVGIDLNL